MKEIYYNVYYRLLEYLTKQQRQIQNKNNLLLISARENLVVCDITNFPYMDIN